MSRGGERGPVRARLIACAVFEKEVAALPEALRRSLDPVYIDSGLHLDPRALDDAIASALGNGAGVPTVLAFGDCCPSMGELARRGLAARTRGANCCEIFLGAARYARYRRSGAFVLMPEWAPRWESIFKESLGLADRTLCREFMAQSMHGAVYVDTGIGPVPREALAGFAEFTGLRVAVEPAGPGHFIAAIRAALAEAMAGAAPEGASLSDSRHG
ncbi:MAG: DUF1638 domain-containing protein [Spirochaetes bacterium]|nr:DUF1638 domain-containing protein [Spirochaetota bacterium]MBU1080249.1 DUF1638 domain-containing protein [Spirochaetota bacterium]